jgi:hypothetical protein
MSDFDLYYSDNPWEAVDKNQRTFYDPALVNMFRQQSVFTPAIRFAINMTAAPVSAKTMKITQLLDPHPDYTALSLRQLWLPAAHIDSREVSVTFERYGGKVAYHKYDDMVTYWQQDGQKGLLRILNSALGFHMVSVLDYVARNAHISGALTTGYVLYGGNATSFGDIAGADKMTLDTTMDIRLGMQMREVTSVEGAFAQGSVLCLTTPGVIYDLQLEAEANNRDWTSITEALQLASRLRYEVGEYKGVRFVSNPRLVLWNCGEIIAQAPVTAAINAGDGAPAAGTKVDGTYQVGQATADIKNYVDVGSFITGSLTNFVVGDMITIHVTRTSGNGVTNGVDFTEGTLHNRRIVSKDTVNGRITLDLPVMVDMNTDLGGGVYAYVTKATHVHASIFIGGPQGIVSGVGQPPRLYTPPPVDDFVSIHRFSWDAYIGYQPYAPEVFEVMFTSGSVRIKGATTVQAATTS